MDIINDLRIKHPGYIDLVVGEFGVRDYSNLSTIRSVDGILALNLFMNLEFNIAFGRYERPMGDISRRWSDLSKHATFATTVSPASACEHINTIGFILNGLKNSMKLSKMPENLDLVKAVCKARNSYAPIGVVPLHENLKYFVYMKYFEFPLETVEAVCSLPFIANDGKTDVHSATRLLKKVGKEEFTRAFLIEVASWQ
jgi:hypothetical protein